VATSISRFWAVQMIVDFLIINFSEEIRIIALYKNTKYQILSYTLFRWLESHIAQKLHTKITYV